ncbi:MAG TPA: alpha/beta hydrolase [Caulobacteraceae bacterium]|nr:alpha/beta hydrolase [Caulobacteraceae bacterium]
MASIAYAAWAMSLPEPRAATVRLDSPNGAGAFAYLDFGPPDRPVDAVFTHANGFNARSYRTLLQPLAREFRLLAMDLRGHGRTRAPTPIETRETWLDLGDDLVAFLDALDLGPVALGGHSMGGTLSLFSAAARPERVRALALFDPVIRPPAGPFPAEAMKSPMIAGTLRRRRVFPSRAAAVESYRGRGAFTNWTAAMLADYVEDGFADRPDGTVEIACAPEWEVSNYVSQGHDPWVAFEASRCPIHIWRAEQASTCLLDDRVEPLIESGRLKLETVPRTTHFLPMERPDLVQAGLREAIAAPAS